MKVFVDGEPFSRFHRGRAWNLVSGWTVILHLLGYGRDFENETVLNLKGDARISPKLRDAGDRAVELVELHYDKPKHRLIYAPDALAASALYIACIENRVAVPQKVVAWLAGRTEKWVRDNSKKLREELHLRGVDYVS